MDIAGAEFKRYFIFWYTRSRIAEQSDNENNGQRKRYKRHFADVSATPVTIISAFAIELQ